MIFLLLSAAAAGKHASTPQRGHTERVPSVFQKRCCAPFLKRFRFALRLGCAPVAHNSTLASRKEFFPRTRRGKNDSIYFAAPAAKLLRRAFLTA
jgi:hypothetical protein